MEIQRPFYLNELKRKRGNGFIKVITGLRRSGKSYLLRRIFRNDLLSSGVHESQLVEMAFDERDNAAYRNPDLFYDYARKKLADNPESIFLLDEIQLLDDFESVLNGLLAKGGEIYVTGSNAKLLSRDVITEFRGRGDEIHMSPLSFAEYFSAFNDNRDERFNEYMLYGGLPPVVLQATSEDKIAMLNSLYTETYLSDITGRNHLRKPGELDDLLDVLSSNIGSMLNPDKLKNIFKSVKKTSISTVTITKYLNLLEDAFLLEKVRRFNVKGNSYIGTPMKFYYSDLGLRNARLHFRQLEPSHSMENIIYYELRRRRFNVDVGIVPISEKNGKGSVSRKQLEVDFVANKGSCRYYIQSAYMMPDNAKAEQETRPLRSIDDSFKKIIITLYTPAPLYDRNGILTMSIFDFLLNPDSLDF